MDLTDVEKGTGVPAGVPRLPSPAAKGLNEYDFPPQYEAQVNLELRTFGDPRGGRELQAFDRIEEPTVARRQNWKALVVGTFGLVGLGIALIIIVIGIKTAVHDQKTEQVTVQASKMMTSTLSPRPTDDVLAPVTPVDSSVIDTVMISSPGLASTAPAGTPAQLGLTSAGIPVSTVITGSTVLSTVTQTEPIASSIEAAASSYFAARGSNDESGLGRGKRAATTPSAITSTAIASTLVIAPRDMAELPWTLVAKDADGGRNTRELPAIIVNDVARTTFVFQTTVWTTVTIHAPTPASLAAAASSFYAASTQSTSDSARHDISSVPTSTPMRTTAATRTTAASIPKASGEVGFCGVPGSPCVAGREVKVVEES